MNLFDYLQTIPLFSEMTNDELRTLDQSMVLKDYPDHHLLVAENKKPDGLYIILEGNVEVLHEKNTERGMQRVSSMGPGSMLGLHGLITHARPIVTCQAQGKIKAAFLPSSAFNLLYQFNSRLPHHFQMTIAKQLAADYRNIVGELKGMMLAE
jgi:signal-transduction protein with cAMP-binding, CBS, and nucleotidyltransferase domain